VHALLDPAPRLAPRPTRPWEDSRASLSMVRRAPPPPSPLCAHRAPVPPLACRSRRANLQHEVHGEAAQQAEREARERDEPAEKEDQDGALTQSMLLVRWWQAGWLASA
jgi:hypothetical protein